MPRLIKVHTLGEEEIKQVTLQEAEKSLEKTYNDPTRGLVVDVRTGKVIWEIGPEVKEISVLEQ
jgi:predicted ThiF/HesA family dinucleotide-utilizing enzyme